MKNFITWLLAIFAGILLLILLNTSPLARTGLTIKLPTGWQSASLGNYADASCNSRKPEGIPFAFKRPNELQSCMFDINRLGLFLNSAVGTVLGISLVAFGTKQERSATSRNEKHPHTTTNKQG